MAVNFGHPRLARALLLGSALVGLFLLSPMASHGGAAGIGPSDPFDRDIQDLNAGSAKVRRNAASSLANAGIKASRAVPALIAMLPAESDPEARREIVRAIGSAGSRTPDAVPALVEVMEHDPSDELRAGAAKSLGRTETMAEMAVPALLRALESSAPAVRAGGSASPGCQVLRRLRCAERSSPGRCAH